MHPPRPKRVFQGPQFVDHLAEWVVAHCPCTGLSLLILLVAGSRITVSEPLLLVAAVVAVDLGLNLVRVRQRPRHLRRSSGSRTNATA
jgi:hypothetical protein